MEPLTRAQKILDTINESARLQTLPEVACHILRLADDPSTCASDLAMAITEDLALTAKILKMANSAYYGYPSKISTITHAVVILGQRAMTELVLSASLFDVFSDQKTLEQENFWRHSVDCGTTAKMLAKSFHYRASGELFIMGLMHDLGKMLLGSTFPEMSGEITEHSVSNQVPTYVSEKELLGVDHAEAAGLLLTHWNLPPEVANAIRYHHDPGLAKQDQVGAAIVHLADILLLKFNKDSQPHKIIPEINPVAWATLQTAKKDLNETDIDKFMYDLAQILSDSEELYKSLTDE